jgi:NAD(P)H-hydrate epimerase
MITTREMKALEDHAEQHGISKLELMERAGEGIAALLKPLGRRFLFVCYHGNNGGDGFCAAKKLCHEHDVNVLFIGDEKKLKKEAKENYQALKLIEKETGVSLFIREVADEVADVQAYDVVVDAILGIGVKGKLKEPIISAIHLINRASFIVSIDAPTGINPDTGEKQNVFVVPHLIITMHDLKKGLGKYRRLTRIVDIGL